MSAVCDTYTSQILGVICMRHLFTYPTGIMHAFIYGIQNQKNAEHGSIVHETAYIVTACTTSMYVCIDEIIMLSYITEMYSIWLL